MGEGGPSRKRAFPEELPTQQKKVRFPKGKKAKTGDYIVEDASVEVDVPGWRDPRLAANERAVARNELTAELLEEGGEMLEDVSRAEIHYKDNETFVDDGVPMEPFNLEQEREEGYFDADGNYVEYISEDIKDAWLDSIDANRNIAAPTANRTEPKNQDDAVDLSSGNVAEIKRRIADVLEPGETVLQALRRLKGNSNSRKVKMSEETKRVFDQLTEDAMRLLENGDYNVYDEKQETFQREAEGYEKLAEARKQAFTSSTVLDEAGKQASEDMFDMFADEDGSGAAINPAAASSDRNDAASITTPNHGASDSDYVYDETSGYYYSNSLGYYYDPSSGLYCYASTGQWYSFNEQTGAYEECHQQQEEAAAAAAAVSSS